MPRYTATEQPIDLEWNFIRGNNSDKFPPHDTPHPVIGMFVEKTGDVLSEDTCRFQNIPPEYFTAVHTCSTLKAWSYVMPMEFEIEDVIDTYNEE